MSNADISSKSNKIENDKSILRVYISKRWDTQDISSFIFALDLIYRIYYLTDEMARANSQLDRLNRSQLYPNLKFGHGNDFIQNVRHIYEFNKYSVKETNRFRNINQKKDKMEAVAVSTADELELYLQYESPQVLKISYASPGFTDLLGLSSLMKQIKELIQYYIPNKKDKTELQIIEQKKISMIIENLKNAGFSEIEIKEILLRYEKNIFIIKTLSEEKKISNSEIKDYES